MEIILEFKVDAQKVLNNLADKEANLNARMARFMNKVVMMAQGYVKNEAPFKTGGLRRAIQKNVSGSRGIIFIAGGMAPYYGCVIDGTRPHRIYPRNKKSLYWPGLGHPMPKGKPVKHPGTKPNPFVDKAVPDIMNIINQEMAAIIKWLEA